MRRDMIDSSTNRRSYVSTTTRTYLKASICRAVMVLTAATAAPPRKQLLVTGERADGFLAKTRSTLAPTDNAHGETTDAASTCFDMVDKTNSQKAKKVAQDSFIVILVCRFMMSMGTVEI